MNVCGVVIVRSLVRSNTCMPWLVASRPVSVIKALQIGVSKASISTDARRLEQLGLITRISLPGDRRDYYTIDAAAPATGLEMRLRNLRRFDRTLCEAGDRDKLPPVVRDRLARFEYAHHRIVAALEGVLEELKQQHPTAPSAGGSSPQ